ncbi:beta strand repeat-containing protein [Microvirga pakistanensis]|uniref:beta strand repeat-containing protein n=2 Tax=Microvirga pakistanensis TaxID=1682650 RepID=UPI00106B021C|nr:Ig-like domain-containing protein [Microvirga pakistanensis]
MAKPTTTADGFSLVQGTSLSVTSEQSVLGNDADADGDALTASLLYNTSHGALSPNSDGTFTYTPYDPNFTGTDTFVYFVNDGTSDSEPVAVTLTVNPREDDGNSAPVAAANAYEFEGRSLTVAAPAGVLANDSDADGDALTAALLYSPSYGALDFRPDGSFTYTPYDTFTGADEFYYYVNEGAGDSQPVKVTITGTVTADPVDETPVAVADAYTVPLTGAYEGASVLGNDTDAEGGQLTVKLLYNAGKGQLDLRADGTFTYTPYTGMSGADEFWYIANDGTSDSQPIKVTINLEESAAGGNAVPVAADDTYDVVLTNGSYTSSASVLANDTDAEGDALTAAIQWNPMFGSVSLNADGTFTYTLAEWAANHEAFNGTDEFFYYAKDASGQSQLTKVSLTNIRPGEPEPDPVLPEVSVSGTGEVTEGGVATYTFTRTGNTDEALEITVNVGGSAVAGQDYGTVPTKVIFAAGSTTATLDVQTTEDQSVETAETIEVAVAPGIGYTVGSAGSAATDLLDNDVAEEPAADVNVTAQPGTNTYTGGAGNNDTLTIGQTTLMATTNTINLGGSILGTNQWTGGSIQEFENITLTTVSGTAGLSLTINGDEENNVITVGDASLTAPAGRTTRKVVINAGDGNDTINYIGTGAEAQGSALSGGAGNDRVTVGSAAIIDDRAGSGPSGDDTYDFGTNAGRQTALFGADNGNDTILNYSHGVSAGTSQPDILNFASAGIQASNVTVAEEGGDTVFTINQNGLIGTVTVKAVTGLQFGTHWTAEGSPDAPAQQATEGDDTLTAFASDAAVDGLGGNDTLVFEAFGLTGTTTNIINLSGTIQNTPYGGKTIANVENIVLKGVTTAAVPGQALTVNGDAKSNTITVEFASQKVFINGWGGNDTFDFTGTGLGTTSILMGGSGDDTVTTRSALFISDVGSNGEASGNDTYNLGAGAQVLDFWNGSDNDTVNGFVKGEDKLNFNTLTNQPANLVSAAEVNGDTVFATSTGGTVTVKGVTGLVRGTDWTGEALVSVPSGGDPNNFDEGSPQGGSTLSAAANIYNDAAGNSATLINGLGGADTIYGRDGNDVIEGGTGADTIYGGSGNDRIYGDGGGNINTGANAGTHTGDVLYGGDGNDVVAGQLGDDVIVGGHGADTLNGLGGADRYVFNGILDSLPSGGDTIDWQNIDFLDFRQFDFDQNTAGVQGRANPGVTLFVNGPAPGGMMAEDTFYYDAASGRLTLSTDADGIADFAVTLNVVQVDFDDPTHPTSLVANDFLI